MSGLSEALKAHLESGATTICRAWAVTRPDGVVLGFTDHDRVLRFEGVDFQPETGLSATALSQGTGLAVDNTEALGVLSADAITEADLEAGRYDKADVRAWIVNWADPEQRQLQFRGSIGEVVKAGGAFRAELRGLAEVLNRPMGRVYQKPCSAVLGDRTCRFDLETPGYAVELAVERVEENRVLRFTELAGYDTAWFRQGALHVISGAAQGLVGWIKDDRHEAEARVIALAEPMAATLAKGDTVRLVAGCDKRFTTCRLKFNNAVNFQGFPDIPGEDWLTVHASQAAVKSGGSRR